MTKAKKKAWSKMSEEEKEAEYQREELRELKDMQSRWRDDRAAMKERLKHITDVALSTLYICKGLLLSDGHDPGGDFLQRLESALVVVQGDGRAQSWNTYSTHESSRTHWVFSADKHAWVRNDVADEAIRAEREKEGGR